MSELKKSIVKVKVHNKEYLCDTAIDDWEREHGFMHIESLSENQGLLFIYPEVQEEVNYWMKDTPLYLEVLDARFVLALTCLFENRPVSHACLRL